MKHKLLILSTVLFSMCLSGCLSHEETNTNTNQGNENSNVPSENNNQNQPNNENGSEENNSNQGNESNENNNQGNNTGENTNQGNENQGQNEHNEEDLSLVNDGSVNKPYTVAEACAIAKTLGSDEQTPLKYFIKGYLVTGSWNGSGIATYGNANFKIADQGGSDQFTCFQVYYLNNQKFTSSDSIADGDMVIMFTSIVNYHGNTPETTNKGTAYVYAHNNRTSSTVPEQGFPQEDSSISLSTISSVISANSAWKSEGANNSKKYRIKGIAQWAVNSNYGNFDLIDSSGYIYVHGCTRTKQSLIQDGQNGYVINNDRSYSSIGIKAGDEVTVEGWYAYHKYSSSYGISQFTGYVTAVTPKGASNIQGKNYSSTESYSGTYYSSIGDKTGNDLLLGLHNLMDTTHTSWTSYDGLYSAYSSLNETKDFYTNTSPSKKNREHVWPQSLSGSSTAQLYGEDHGGSDLLHVRLADSNNNSARSSSMFGPIYGTSGYKTMSYSGSTANKYCTNVFEPSDAIKGDVARIIMYMYMHYNIASNVNNLSGWNEKSWYGEMHINWVMGTQDVKSSFALLRLWNANDPVSQEEIARNNYAEQHQGNRNPFIDHPSYADKIWG